MGPDTIWVLIPLMGMMIPIVALWTKHQQKIAEMQVGATAEPTADKAAQYETHIQRLEDRGQVLERIVTDRGYDIATQIEALRDQRMVNEGAGVPLGLDKKERV